MISTSYRVADHPQRLVVTLPVYAVRLGPLLEGAFLLLLLALHVEPFDAARHPHGILPIVRRLGVFRGVLDAHLVAREHVFGQDLLPLAADEDALRIGDREHPVDFIRGHVTLRRAGEAHDHGEISFVVPVERNAQVFVSAIGDILRRILRRTVVLAGVDAEHREIARMARPHPVVGVAAELADRIGRRTHQTDILVYLHRKGEILVAAEEGFDRDLHAGVLLAEAFAHLGDLFLHQFGALLAHGRRRHGTQHVGRHVGDTADETHFGSGGGKLLGTRTRPESVFQKVVLDRRQRLDGAVAAVVVRQQQPLGRDHLARTSRAEDDDRIFERRTVGGINLLGREFAPLGPHVGDIHLLQIGQQPHSLVGGRRRGEECREQKHRKFFHRY